MCLAAMATLIIYGVCRLRSTAS
jgi:hypothetical protein